LTPVPALLLHIRDIVDALHKCTYKGRSINKYQNGAIPTVLKIGKIRNIQLWGI